MVKRPLLWFRTYTWPKAKEKSLWWIAAHLPWPVRYFAFMLELGARTTQGGVPVPEKTVDEILKAGRTWRP
jgi:hypothetical protein